MKVPRSGALLTSLFLFVLASGAEAQDGEEVHAGAWEIGGFGGMIDDRPEFEIRDGLFRVEHVKIGGIRAAYRFDSEFFVEGTLAYAPVHLRFKTPGEPPFVNELDGVFFNVTGGHNLTVFSRIDLLARAGLGAVRWHPKTSNLIESVVESETGEPEDRQFTFGNEVDFTLNSGLGLRLFVTRMVAIRMDAMVRFVPSALTKTQRGFTADHGPFHEGLWMTSVTTGLSFFVGGSH